MYISQINCFTFSFSMQTWMIKSRRRKKIHVIKSFRRMTLPEPLYQIKVQRYVYLLRRIPLQYRYYHRWYKLLFYYFTHIDTLIIVIVPTSTTSTTFFITHHFPYKSTTISTTNTYNSTFITRKTTIRNMCTVSTMYHCWCTPRHAW